MTKRNFIKQSSHPEVYNAVIKQIGGWRSFKESANDIATYGIGGGFPGFVYYADTVKFYKQNKQAILSMCTDNACGYGYNSATEMIAGFAGISLSTAEIDEVLFGFGEENETQVFNILAWYAAEEAARAYVDLV